MNKTRFLTIAVILLLVLNLTMLVFILQKGKHHRQGPKAIIVERLGFDKDQTERYEELIGVHQKRMRDLELQLQAETAVLYGLLGESDRSQSSTIEKEIGLIQQEMSEVNFQHFTDIESLCRPEQLPEFKSMSADFVKLFRRFPPPAKKQ